MAWSNNFIPNPNYGKIPEKRTVRRRYTIKEKIHIVQEAMYAQTHPGKGVICESIHRTTLARWIRQYKDGKLKMVGV